MLWGLLACAALSMQPSVREYTEADLVGAAGGAESGEFYVTVSRRDYRQAYWLDSLGGEHSLGTRLADVEAAVLRCIDDGTAVTCGPVLTLDQAMQAFSGPETFHRRKKRAPIMTGDLFDRCRAIVDRRAELEADGVPAEELPWIPDSCKSPEGE